jgi:ADP-heptose:LPS heptosyltransferase
MKNLYVVTGGLGKTLLWTSLIPSLCKKDEVDKISVMTVWPFLFEINDQIENIEPLLDFRHFPHLEKYDNIIYHEPYLSDYLKEENLHMLDYWADAYGIERIPPKPIIDYSIASTTKFELSESLTDPYYVIQFIGGASRHGEHKLCPRDYRPDLIEKLNRKIKNEFNLKCVCFRYENEPKPSDTITFRSRTEIDTLGIIPLIDNAKFVVCIDSALMHFAAATNKDEKTIVLWNKPQTTPSRIGYPQQTNIIDENELCIELPPEEILNKIKEVV